MTASSRLPRLLPAWVKKRVQVEVYKIHELVRTAAGETPPGKRFLDAGAGEGQYREFFTHTCYTGVDLAVGDVAWDYSSLDAISTLDRLPFASGCFHSVLLTQVLEHLREPDQTIGELFRVLQPGGKLYLSAPQSWAQHQKPHDYYRYTSFGLRYLLEKNGFIVERIEPHGGYFWFLSFQLSNFNYWVFSPRRGRYHWLTWPLRALFGFLFQLITPLILFYLDPLDPVKDETLGYNVIATKPPTR